jgi:predicted neutral ceramidase superfamily lipid hydrolase
VDRENQPERVNRELIELLNELRVALPGVQVLFAFLLTIPFAKGFATTTPLQRDVFFVALASAVVATILLMAPSAYHRILFRQRDKERLIRHSNRLALAGIAALAVALASSLFVVTDYVFGEPTAGIATGVGTCLIAVLWCGIPLWLRST